MAFSFHPARALRSCILITWLIAAAAGATESRNLAPGFTALAKGTPLLVMQPDIELFSISGGGVVEPKADWTEQAHKHIHDALNRKTAALGLQTKNGKLDWSFVDAVLYDFRSIDPQINVADNENLIKGERYASN